MNKKFSTLQQMRDTRTEVLVCCLLITTTTATGDVAKSRQYTAMVSSAACAADNPTLAIPLTKYGSVVRCSGECTAANDSCLVYQLNKSKGECQIFKFLPKNWIAVDGCTAFFFNDIAVTNEVNAASVCSLPFTSDGQLYHQCAVNYSTRPYNVWCPKSNRQQVNCSTESYGYVVLNTTVDVVINTSTFTSRVNLQSVAGWLTVLSRVDGNFPLGLAPLSYANGFGNNGGNFWLGLERIYLLTNSAVNGGKTYSLRFEFLQMSNNKWYSIEYDWFHLDDSTTSYTFRASSTSTGDAGDSINGVSLTNNRPFASSTSQWCVGTYGPWWYYNPTHSCCHCRLFGGYPSGFAWDENQLLIIRMMVKAMN